MNNCKCNHAIRLIAALFASAAVFPAACAVPSQYAAMFPPTNTSWRVVYSARVAETPPLRGVMLPGGTCAEDDFKTLNEWGATLSRYQMIRGWHKQNDNQDLANFDRWLDGKLDHLERDVLPWAKKYSIRIVVDLHVPPGGRDNGEMNMFHNPLWAEHFIASWRRIATRFKGRPEIFGFDLINEPSQNKPAPPGLDYWNLQRRAAEAVRAIDPDTPIIVAANQWDSAPAFEYLSPLALDNVIYQVHMYQPFEFTHQGVHAANADYKKFTYPNAEKGWNRDYIRKCLAPVVEFQKRHNARIYVGEFSAITWADGADRYIADCISVFEEYGWDWTYHAFREWPGWSVEHEATAWQKFSPSADNPRRRALLAGLALSRRKPVAAISIKHPPLFAEHPAKIIAKTVSPKQLDVSHLRYCILTSDGRTMVTFRDAPSSNPTEIPVRLPAGDYQLRTTDGTWFYGCAAFTVRPASEAPPEKKNSSKPLDGIRRFWHDVRSL